MVIIVLEQFKYILAISYYNGIVAIGIANILLNCDSSKSPGPDSIHSFTLKATATEISSMLAHIFSQSLETGSVPSDWKHAYVTPIL